MISIQNLTKIYDHSLTALSEISLEIQPGEIFALLGPNGAGKTTLISSICGLTKQNTGSVKVAGFDTIKDYKKTRSLIGLVPQEFPLENFESVIETVKFSRGLFGKSPDPFYIEKTLKSLNLWEKRDTPIIALSGGMKRRVLIAKALSHKPKILFLDEPTSGVDVQLRKGMWDLISTLKKDGVTVILTTHYIEEAEAIADRVAVINQGEIIVVEDKKELIKKMGHKKLTVELQEEITKIPENLIKYNLEIGEEHMSLIYTYNVQAEKTGITNLLQDIKDTGLKLKDLKTEQSTLEKIFVNLVREKNEN